MLQLQARGAEDSWPCRCLRTSVLSCRATSWRLCCSGWFRALLGALLCYSSPRTAAHCPAPRTSDAPIIICCPPPPPPPTACRPGSKKRARVSPSAGQRVGRCVALLTGQDRPVRSNRLRPSRLTPCWPCPPALHSSHCEIDSKPVQFIGYKVQGGCLRGVGCSPGAQLPRAEKTHHVATCCHVLVVT